MKNILFAPMQLAFATRHQELLMLNLCISVFQLVESLGLESLGPLTPTKRGTGNEDSSWRASR